MRTHSRFRSIALTLILVATCCSGRASHAAAAGFERPAVGAPASLGNDTSAIELVGRLGGGATGVQVVGARAYVGGPDGLRIVDVSDPASPTVLGSYPGEVADAHVVGAVVYLAGPSGLRIVDVGDAAHPVLRGGYDLPPRGETYFQRASRVQVVGEYAYVIFQQTIFGIPPYRGELAIVDVRDRSKPALRGRYDLGPSFSDLAVVDGYAYIGGATDVGGATGRFFNAYLSIIDVHDPASPALVGKYQRTDLLPPSGAGDVAVADGVAYLGLATGPALYTWDVRDRSHPTPLGSLAIGAGALRVADQFAYVAETGAGLAIVDIRDPAAPARRASYSPLGMPGGVDVAADLVYVAAGEIGLRIMRFIPRTTALIPTGGGTLEATVGRVSYQFPSGAFAETASVTHTLRIADDLPPAPALTRIGPAFEITASYSATGQLAPPALPITITAGYTDSERGPAIVDTPALYFWDGGAWVQEPSSALDQTARRVTATSRRLGIWALMGESRRAFLPAQRR